MTSPTNGWDLTIGPAYGRDYKTADEAFKAWIEGKDFYIYTPGQASYLNRYDLEEYNTTETSRTVRIRYNQLTELLFVTLVGDWKSGKWVKGESTSDLLIEEING